MEKTPLDKLLPAGMSELRSRPLMDFFVEVKKPWIVGKTPAADRRIGEISGGYFEGGRLRGTILTGGSDWQTVRDDGAWTLNVRALLETDDGALIGMTYTGIRHGPKDVIDALARGEAVSPNDYYMRAAPVFETAAGGYDWLNRIVCVAHGHRIAGGAIYRAFEILTHPVEDDMTATAIPHDYPVTEANCAVKAELGIAKAEWYHGPIPRAELKELMRRRDGPALVTTGLWLGGLIVTGVSAWLLVGSWWSVPFFIVYGVLYGSSADARWHEMGHGTAFRTRWLNEVVYQLACFMLFREPTVWRWSHTRHHTDTIVVGCDPEIVAERPPTIPKMISNLLTLHLGYTLLKNICLHATGRLTVAERTFIPEQEQWKVTLVARIWIVILAGVVVWSLAAWSILPLMFVGLPTFYGGWLHGMFAITQHVGLAEDVVDHRLNTRTIYFNPVFRFSYLNMNYHIEHHMFPMVPYYNLPKLHEKLKADMPRPYDGLWDAFQEIIPTLLRQLREPGHHVVRDLPPTARPYLQPQPLGAAVPAE